MIALVVLGAAFSTDALAQKGGRMRASATVGGHRSLQAKDGTSNTLMGAKRVATGDVNGDSLIATTYGRGNARRSRIVGDWDGDGRDTVGITVDPSDPTGNTVYIGRANGGVWKSANTGRRSKLTAGEGITIKTGNAQRRLVQGNYIGTDISGSRTNIYRPADGAWFY